MINNNIQNVSSVKVFTRTVALILILFTVSLVTRVQASFGNIATHPQLQSIVEDILKKGIAKAQAKSGFALVSDPSTGEIMAISHLQLENGKFSAKSAEDFVKSTYQPYSHMKPMIAAIALEKGTMHENTILNAEGGKMVIDGKTFYDWKDHGKISLINTVALSSFLGSFRIAESVGLETLTKGLQAFGFGSGSSVSEVPYAKNGKILFKQGESEQQNLAYISNGIGKIFVSPLEIVQAYSSMANGGKLIRPREFSGNKSDPNVIRNSISEATAERMKYVLLRTMTHGTGKWAQSSHYTIAGKTSSGYVDEPVRTKGKKFQANRAQFIGFAPFNRPKLIALVIVDHPEGGAHGSKHAAPIVRTILNKSLQKLEVKPDHMVSSN